MNGKGMRRLLAVAATGAIFALPAMAANWDEGVDGDLSNDEASPSILALDLGANVVSGVIGGGGLGDPPPADFADAFTVSVGAGQSLDSAILDVYMTAGGNASSGFNVATGTSWDGSFAAANFVGSATLTAGGVGGDILDDPDYGGSLGPGDYVISLREGTPGQTYSITFNLIPEPTSLSLLSLAGLALLRRR